MKQITVAIAGCGGRGMGTYAACMQHYQDQMKIVAAADIRPSQLALMLQWYSRDFQDPTEEMAKKLLRIVHAPMIDPHDSKI